MQLTLLFAIAPGGEEGAVPGSCSVSLQAEPEQWN